MSIVDLRFANKFRAMWFYTFMHCDHRKDSFPVQLTDVPEPKCSLSVFCLGSEPKEKFSDSHRYQLK